MFVLINFYFRPYEFLAVYQRIACAIFMLLPNSVYILPLKRV